MRAGLFRTILHTLLVLSLIACGAVHAQSAQALRARHAQLGSQLASNVYQRPLLIESTESKRQLSGDAWAEVNHPFATVSAALNDATHWCDILILHLNTKFCRASGGPARAALQVAVGKKHDQPLHDAHRLEFSYRGVASTPDYFRIELDAPRGPLGTSDYRIVLEAVALPGAKTFLHLQYSYGYNFGARMAMQGYLATIGRDKVGFSREDGDYVRGMRGVVERNTMRYYLAIDAYLAALAAPPAARLERRLQGWFTATERYPRQLREIDRDAYLAMKRAEAARQQGR